MFALSCLVLTPSNHRVAFRCRRSCLELLTSIAFAVVNQVNNLLLLLHQVHEQQDTGEVNILTKGDNNDVDDRMLYAQGQRWLQRHHVMGRAVGFLPYVGWMTIIMTEKPIIKYIVIGALGLLVITSKD
uniref:Signal peptidase complex catalytic subunit SEC11 n=1 Tax=Fagus sylvatica TaxID=28930 RepID=A0A2N9IAN0_FAGSY